MWREVPIWDEPEPFAPWLVTFKSFLRACISGIIHTASFNFIPCNIQNRDLTRAAITSSTSCRLCQCTSAMMSILRGWKCSNNNCCTFLGVSEFWCEIIIPAMQWSSRLTASKQQSLSLIECGVHSYCTSTMDDFSVTFNNSGVMFERLLPLKEHNHRMERMWA